MQTARYVYRQDGGFWPGHVEEPPDYWSQGEILDDLVEHLRDLDLGRSSGRIPDVSRVGKLTLS